MGGDVRMVSEAIIAGHPAFWFNGEADGAVRRFQGDTWLTTDGFVGQQTWNRPARFEVSDESECRGRREARIPRMDSGQPGDAATEATPARQQAVRPHMSWPPPQGSPKAYTLIRPATMYITPSATAGDNSTSRELPKLQSSVPSDASTAYTLLSHDPT